MNDEPWCACTPCDTWLDDEVDESPQFRAIDGTPVCCDQAAICWPYPCPWHTDTTPKAVALTEALKVKRAIDEAKRTLLAP